MTKMNRDVAMSREIIDYYENKHFSKIFLDHEDFVSGMPFVSFYNDFGQT